MPDYAGLRAAHKSFGRFACEFLVKGFVVVEPLTDWRVRHNPRSICKTSLSDNARPSRIFLAYAARRIALGGPLPSPTP